MCALPLASFPEPYRRPGGDAARAAQAARDRLGYGDTTSGLVEYEPEEVAAASEVDSVWGFWWA
jgi:hypothetical protein